MKPETRLQKDIRNEFMANLATLDDGWNVGHGSKLSFEDLRKVERFLEQLHQRNVPIHKVEPSTAFRVGENYPTIPCLVWGTKLVDMRVWYVPDDSVIHLRFETFTESILYKNFLVALTLNYDPDDEGLARDAIFAIRNALELYVP